MQLIGFLLVVISLWMGYSSVNSFNPLTLGLAILSKPADAGSLISTSQATSAATVAQASSSGTTTLGSNFGSLSTAKNPFAGYKVTDTFAAHIARHSTAPGIDYAMAPGTILHSPISGTLQYVPNANAQAGNQIRILASNGDILDFDHVEGILSSLKNGMHISAGQSVGFSGGVQGAPGAGDAQGSGHVHVDIRNSSGKYFPITDLWG